MTTVNGDVQGETKAVSIGETPVSTAAHVRHIETCIISYTKRLAGPSSIHDTG